MTELDAILADIGDAEAHLARARQRLTDYAAVASARAKPLKTSMGGLTEEGVRVCNAAFARGETPTEISKLLGITIPAVCYRKGVWEREQRRNAERERARAGARNLTVPQTA